MGKHGKKRRYRFAGWLAACMVAGGIIGGVALAPSAPVSHQTPLPVFTHVLAPKSSPAPSQSAPVLTYVVVSGNTLSEIAQEKCGNPLDYRSLQKYNKISNPGAISVGEVIKIEC
jgi:nucleoid-associated protein YgaU